MKTAIISYDLQHIQPGDNERVKTALEQFLNAHASVQTIDVFSPFPRWVNLSLPDTTLLVTVANPAITTAGIAGEVAGVINGVGAHPGRIYVAFLSLEDDFLVNTPDPRRAF